MYKGNLSLPQTNALSLLISQKLLLQKDGRYETTNRGRQFLSAYDQLEKIIGMPALPATEIRVFSSSSASQTSDIMNLLQA